MDDSGRIKRLVAKQAFQVIGAGDILIPPTIGKDAGDDQGDLGWGQLLNVADGSPGTNQAGR